MNNYNKYKHNNNDTVYILDFDGVICDSIDECMLNSYNTFDIWIALIDCVPSQEELLLLF